MNPSLRTAWLLGALSAPATGQSPWRPGQPVPDLRLPTVAGGRTVSLSDYRGSKLVLIEFASW